MHTWMQRRSRVTLTAFRGVTKSNRDLYVAADLPSRDSEQRFRDTMTETYGREARGIQG